LDALFLVLRLGRTIHTVVMAGLDQIKSGHDESVGIVHQLNEFDH
jgi:hypothetical protein